jgi:curved DNA-binding protein
LYTAVLGGKINVPTFTGNVKVKVPKGSENGKVLRLKGKGMPNYKNPNKFGDLLVHLNYSIPKNLNEKEIKLFKELKAIRDLATVHQN